MRISINATGHVDPDQPGEATPAGPSDRTSRRSRLATLGLVLTLLAVSLFAFGSAQATSRAAQSASRASAMFDDYATAATALAAEEPLGRKYRVERGAELRKSHDAVALRLVATLARIRRNGDAADRAMVDRLLIAHQAYQSQTTVGFDAVDRGDHLGVQRADKASEPIFAVIKHDVDNAAAVAHRTSLARLAQLQHRAEATSRLTPLVFLAGLLLAAALGSIGRAHQRLLQVERTQAVHDSMHDGLTGLPNRTLFADRVTQALRAARRDGIPAALLLVDLDRFREINDTFGHHCGDLLLSQIGPRLAGALRELDTVARLGGDEFAVLLPEVRSVPAAMAIADKLRVALERPFHVESGKLGGVLELDLEASVGVVLSGEHGSDADTLLQRADVAMYVAKSQNLGVSAYDPAVDGNSPAKLAMFGELRRALDRSELVLHYQPKLDIGSGHLLGAEALVRWQHPDRGLVPPDEFIPLAEHTGLIGPLTRYVLDRALAQVRIWSDTGRPMTVAVNLSARNLLDERLPAMVTELLSAHGVPAGQLQLEITESALMTEPGRARRLLEQLAGLGVSISIDDFGAGYTSLGQLKDLPVSELKVDRSFVMTMTEDASNAHIVSSVVDLGHNLGLTIVAEGVESAQALSALAGYGCDAAQGFHLARPMPVVAFDAWCATRSDGPRALPDPPVSPAAAQARRSRGSEIGARAAS